MTFPCRDIYIFKNIKLNITGEKNGNLLIRKISLMKIILFEIENINEIFFRDSMRKGEKFFIRV